MRTMAQHGDRVALSALVAGGVLAGGNALGVRFTVFELDALWGAGLRFAIAALLLAGVMVALRLRRPGGAVLRGAALYGVLNFGGAFAAAYYALSHIQAGLASTVIALVPLATLLLAVAQRRERLRLASVTGGILALAGVAVVSKVSLAGAVPPLALAAAFAGIACMAQAAIVARGLAQSHEVHPVVLNAVGMAAGAVVLLAGAIVAGDEIALPRQPVTWWAIGYLVIGGSIGVFMLYLVVLRHWEASRAAYLTMLMPPVAVALSSWLDHEPITAGLVVGGGLILAGVYVGAVRPTSPAPVAGILGRHRPPPTQPGPRTMPHQPRDAQSSIP